MGKYVYGSFHFHDFSNNSEYLVTRRHEVLPDKKKPGCGPGELGIFILHWPTNTWTPVSTPDLQASTVAAHFYLNGAKRPALPPFEGGVAVAVARTNTLPALPRVEVDVTITHARNVPAVKDVPPVYPDLISFIQVRVDQVHTGTLPDKNIVLGMLVMKNREQTPAAHFKIGDKLRVTLEPFRPDEHHKGIASQQQIDASEDFDLKQFWAIKQMKR